MKNALISVADKHGLEDIGRKLVEREYQLISTGGTARTLRDAGLPVIEVSDFTGFPEILGDLVKTLNPKVHGGLLPARTNEFDCELAEHGIERIDFLYVSIYELLKLLKTTGYGLGDIVGKSDMGGPAMIASGAKGALNNLLAEKTDSPYFGPVVACSLESCNKAINWIDGGMPDKDRFVVDMAAEAFWVCACHRTGGAVALSGGRYFALLGERATDLKYGENPQQSCAALYMTSDDPFGMDKFVEVDGQQPGYVNYTDIDRGVELLERIVATWDKNIDSFVNVAVGLKHGNACGAALGNGDTEVIRGMLDGDPLAIFGGIVVTNFGIEEEIADTLLHQGMKDGSNRLIDLVVAPYFSAEAVELLRRKGAKGRLMSNPALREIGVKSFDNKPQIRPVRGGFLLQECCHIPDFSDPRIAWSTGQLPNEWLEDLILATSICSCSNSNTITLVKGGKLIGNGVGQQDRVGAAELAITRARRSGHDPAGSLACSDSFFPFPDAPELLAKQGVSVIFATSGSKNDERTAEACRKCDVILGRVPDSVGRMFAHH